MLKITPPLWSSAWRMTSMARVVTRAVPKKRVSISWWVSSSVADSVSPESEYPALLTTTSRWKSLPKCSAAAAKAALTELAEVTSRASLRMLGFASGRYERLDGLRAVAIRRWSGLLATKVARARPMPVEQPVTVWNRKRFSHLCHISGLEKMNRDSLNQTAPDGRL